MDHEFYEEWLEVPSGIVNGISIAISTDFEKEKLSVTAIDAVGEVSDSKLGLPNPTSECSSCGAKDMKTCEGHFGFIKFPYTIQHPYFLSEVTKILNKICPACKSIRKDLVVKGTGSLHKEKRSRGCKYCVRKRSWYPRMKFKVSSKDLSRKTCIIVEINENPPKKSQKLPDDYWDFIPKDAQQEDSLKPNRKVLTHAQVRYLLKDLDQGFIEKFILRKDALFLNCFPVTPNNHRVTEVTHAFSNGKTLIFDQRTRAYRKMVDFRGRANELSSLVHDCLKISKLHLDKSSIKDSAEVRQKKNFDVSNSSGLRWVKDVVLGKRNDHCFRMVVTGDPNIKLREIGIPCHVAERLQISEHLTAWNWERLNACSSLHLLEKGELYVRRKGSLVRVRRVEALQLGDTIYRPLSDGDSVLINRPPSIHPHSLIALSVKVLPVSSVVTINPLCCSPFHGDFDGDCLHGYIPQSIDARIELTELVALDRQLINQQSGKNLLSLSQDSLTAAHLVMEDGVLLSLLQMQQLQMFCPHRLLSPAIVKTPSLNSGFWTGKQLFSMLLPPDFEYTFPSKGVYISRGELLSSEGSTWLRDNDENLFQSLIKHHQDKALDFLYAAQEVLCEWLSMRGLSVSLLDLYLSSDSCSRNVMMDEIFYGLQEAQDTCNLKQLMVDPYQDFLMSAEDSNMAFEVQHLAYEKQRSAALSQASVDAFRQVFWDIQNLAYKYANKDNSLMVMFKAGSKGNLLKLVQHSLCLGLQHSLAPLSFRFPHELSCTAWNILKAGDAAECAKCYIPSAVIENSFLTGLNPLECFVHSVTSRDSSFSDNADLPGTLTRRLMFFMRDLNSAYDGTVRNAYGNQLVQFSYNVEEGMSTSMGGIGGQAVGSLSASAISEAAYGSLDQPISILETSPLLNLKNVLECGSKKSNADQTMSLYLSEKLGKKRHGFEYGALEVKNHLECLTFSDIVSTAMIIYSPQTCSNTRFSPWICHFHLQKEVMEGTRLNVHSVITSLYMQCNSARKESRISIPDLYISNKDCASVNMQNDCNDTSCITIMIVENSKKSFMQFETIRKLVMPFLFRTVVKGFREIKKVDILWKDRPKASISHGDSFGELYLRVSISRDRSKTNLWSVLVNDCLQIMDMIDWTRSHPDNIRSFCLAYGIGAGLNFFLNNLKSAISDTGKTILPKHLLLVANSLSATGEFVGLNAKGISQQREHASVSSPFVQAFFSNPGACFIKSAKAGVVDSLQGSVDALAWGKVPSVGTGGPFDIIYSGEGHTLAEPVNVYSLLDTPVSSKQNVKFEECNAKSYMTDKCGAQYAYTFGGSASKGLKKLEFISRSLLRSFLSLNDIQHLSRDLKSILHKYPVGQRLSELDERRVIMGLYFHPRRDEKIGIGAQEIKVTYHPEHQSTRCFSLVRTDGTIEDFSYRKCVLGALEIIAPGRAKSYQAKWLQHAKA